MMRSMTEELFGRHVVAAFADLPMYLAIRGASRACSTAARLPGNWRLSLLRHISPKCSAGLKERLMKRRVALSEAFSVQEFVERRDWLSAVCIQAQGDVTANQSLAQVFLYLKQQEPRFTLQQVNWLLGDLWDKCRQLRVLFRGEPTLVRTVTGLFLCWIIDPFTDEEPAMFEQVAGVPYRTALAPWSQFDQEDGCYVAERLGRFTKLLDTDIPLAQLRTQWLTMTGRLALL